MHPASTDWAIEITVWATEFPVAQTVSPKTLALRRVSEGAFRPYDTKISRELTYSRAAFQDFARIWQIEARHAGVISDRVRGWWVSRAFSRLTNVKGVIAHGMVTIQRMV